MQLHYLVSKLTKFKVLSTTTFIPFTARISPAREDENTEPTILTLYNIIIFYEDPKLSLEWYNRPLVLATRYIFNINRFSSILVRRIIGTNLRSFLGN